MNRILLVSLVNFLALSAAEADTKVIALSFETYGKIRQSAVASVNINGKNFALIVDTGANNHYFGNDMADVLKLRNFENTTQKMFDGKAVAFEVSTVEADIRGVPVSLIHPTRGPLPESLKKENISGMLSPQRLDGEALTILDLKTPSLVLVNPAPKNLIKWLEQKYPDFSFEEVPFLTGSQKVEHDLKVVNAKVERFGNLEMLLDSGANNSHVHWSTIEIKKPTYSVHILNHECMTSQLRVVKPDVAPLKDLLGMDCLRGAILVLPPHQQRVFLGWQKKPRNP